jgi:cell division protein YceG involved in septum cleavage
MKRLRIIVISFISILIIGIIITNFLINTKLENGIHKIELQNEDAKSVEVSVESNKDTLSFKDDKNSISEIEKDYVKTVLSFLETYVSLKSGVYKITF